MRTGSDTLRWLVDEIGIGEPAALQLVEYLRAAYAALGCLPTQDTIVLERFFDEAGGMQLVVHSPYGSRINRAWGLALRKRFCRKFNFELQAAATEDNIVLSLTTAHSFELGEVARYLHSASVRGVLIQAMLDAPMFITRWRWVAGVSLALPRFRGGRKVPPQLARMEAEDLIGSVFPDQIACAENLAGEREVPDHPLVNQTICRLPARGDGHRWPAAAARAASSRGAIRVVARDLTEPSPLALEVLSARPYAYPRRCAAGGAPHAGRHGPALARPGDRRRPRPARSRGDRARARRGLARGRRIADELHDALVWLGFLTEAEARAGAGWSGWLGGACRREARRAAASAGGDAVDRRRAAAAVPRAVAGRRGSSRRSPLPAAYAEREWTPEEALVEIVRGRLEGQGPVTQDALAAPLGLEPSRDRGRAGGARGRRLRHARPLHAGGRCEEWCERRLLARIHRYTVKRLRAEIEPVAARDFLRFLFAWQRVAADARMEGPDALDAVVGQLEGFEAPAGAWETEILPARLAGYEPAWLDDRCLAGRVAWTRLRPRSGTRQRQRAHAPRRCARRRSRCWRAATRRSGHRLSTQAEPSSRAPRAQAVADFIAQHGASFFDEMVAGTRPAALPGRGGAGRAGRARPGQLRQLRRLARAAGAVRRAQAARRRPPPAAHRDVRHGGRRPLGAGAPRRGRRSRAPQAASREAVEHVGAHAAAPLRRGVLAPARARGRLAAAVARPAARLSPAREARRDPRRPLRRRLLRRAVRAARRGRHAARGPAQAGVRTRWSRCRAPTRSTSSAS